MKSIFPDAILRVGIVGANSERSWAKEAHVPALQNLSGFKLTAVATRSEKSARAAAEAFGATQWFDDAFALVRSQDVDIVSVCVKVPEHRPILLAALAAGKHVYCEWPLGRSLEEAEELAAAAENARVHVAIGLQARMSPAARRAKQLVQDGAVGRLLSARILSTTGAAAPTLPSAFAYLNDPGNGATVSTILGGHTLDLASFVLGSITEIDAVSAIHFPSVHLKDTNEDIERLTPDQLLILSQHVNGCIVSTDIGGPRGEDTPFAFEILGTEGCLKLLGGDTHGFQGGELRLESDRPFPPPDAPIAADLPREAAHVAEVYAAFGRDIRAGTRTVPDFNHAVQLTRLIDAVGLAARTGARQQASDWPK